MLEYQRCCSASGACISRHASWRSAFSLRVRRWLCVLCFTMAVPGSPAVMGEAEEGEGLRTPLATLLSGHGRKPAKRDQPRLVLVHRQAELGQPILEVDHHPPGIARALEAHHEVSRAAESHHRALAEPDVKLSPHPALIAQPRPW